MQFVDIKNDIAFRKIFGNKNKKITLISFLNAVMKLEGSSRIADVEVLNPYQLPIIKNLKASIIDVKAHDEKGNTFIVEMQVAEPDGLDKRLLYYASKDYSQQIESGELFTQLRPVIFIGIFNFYFTIGNKYLSHHAICDVEDGERIIKDMDFYFIELPKFEIQLAGLNNITDKWIFFIKESENLQVVPDNLDDEGLKEAYHDANKHSWGKEELEAYDYSVMREQDHRGKIIAAEKKGKVEGKVEAKIELMLEMLHDGLPLERIAKISKMNMEEIK
jgi:predicted transposase/invertase (TIGR01784 family)